MWRQLPPAFAQEFFKIVRLRIQENSINSSTASTMYKNHLPEPQPKQGTHQDTTQPDELLAGLTGLESSGSGTGLTSPDAPWDCCKIIKI